VGDTDPVGGVCTLGARMRFGEFCTLCLGLIREWMPSTAACMDCGSVLGAVTEGGEEKERNRKKGCSISEDGLSWCSLHLEDQARHGRQELPMTTFYLTVTRDKW